MSSVIYNCANMSQFWYVSLRSLCLVKIFRVTLLNTLKLAFIQITYTTSVPTSYRWIFCFRKACICTLWIILWPTVLYIVRCVVRGRKLRNNIIAVLTPYRWSQYVPSTCGFSYTKVQMVLWPWRKQNQSIKFIKVIYVQCGTGEA